ncbi:unnamed protein product [Mucor hiemalis]
MNDQQDVLSKSYSESISSELHKRFADEDDHTTPSLRRYYSNSIKSNISNPSHYYTDPMRKNDRRGSMATLGDSSSYYDPITEEDERDFFGSQNGSDNEDDVDKVTPLPKVQMGVLAIILFSEPLTSSILFPFIYYMIKDFHISDDEKDIGRYAGWITSIFFVAQFCTAIMWGKVSDRYGRRPVLLTGLIGNTISSCLFGLSKNLWWAIASRALCGVVNGNAGVARSMVSEITDDTNKAKAFATFGFSYGMGIIGPALGGYLSHPAENFPSIFGNCQFLKDFPYFLPCFTAAIGSMIGFIIGFFYLQESNVNVIAHKKQQETKKANERTQLLRNDTRVNDDAEISSKVMMPRSGSIRNITRASVVVIIVYSTFGFHSMVFDEVLPLYSTAPSYAGGLGITPSDFAKVLSILGVLQLFLQFGVYPRVNRILPTLALVQIGFVMYMPIYILFPELTALKDLLGSSDNWTFKLIYLFVLIVRFAGNCLTYTGLGIMVSTSASPEILGTVNGICQSSLSLVRALGPTFGGTLWSYSLKDHHSYPFDHHFVYYVIFILNLFSLFQSFSIPKSVSLGGRKK